MAKSVHNDVLDQALNYLKNQCTQIVACKGPIPTTYASAISGNKLAISNISGADFTGPADGDTNGRKITVGQKANVPVSVTGSVVNIAIVDSSGSRLLYVTEVSGVQLLTSGNTMTFQAWDIEIADPV